MAVVPINRFRVVTTTLNSGSNTVYSENVDIAAILLSAAVTNVTNTMQTVSVQVQKSGSVSGSYLLYNTAIPVGEAINPFPGKVILEKNDALKMETASSGSLHVVLSILENATD